MTLRGNTCCTVCISNMRITSLFYNINFFSLYVFVKLMLVPRYKDLQCDNLHPVPTQVCMNVHVGSARKAIAPLVQTLPETVIDGVACHSQLLLDHLETW